MKNNLELWNVLVTFTHASYDMPWYMKLLLNDDFKKYNYRLLKNFSDFATYYLSEWISVENKVVCNYSRAIWDPNRSLDNKDLFKKTDFNWNQVFKKEIPEFLKRHLINKYYKQYHKDIQDKIEHLKVKYWKIIHIDVHDTWNLLLWKDFELDKPRDYYFPELNLFNPENKACSKDIEEKIHNIFRNNFSYNSNIDNPKSTWGFVTRKYWDWNEVHALRLELGRYLFMDEKTQKLNFEKIEEFKKVFDNVLLEIKSII